MKVIKIQSVDIIKYLFPSFLIFDALILFSLVLFLAIKGCRTVKSDEDVMVENGKKKDKKDKKTKTNKTKVKKIEVKPKQENSTKKANTEKNKNSKKKI